MPTLPSPVLFRVSTARAARLVSVVWLALLAETLPIEPASAQRAAYEIPSGCGSERAFRARLGELVGMDAVAAALPERLRIVAQPEGFVLELELGGRTRSLHDNDCQALFRSAVVIAASAAEPRAGLAQGSPPPAPEAATTQAPTEPQGAPAQRTSAPQQTALEPERGAREEPPANPPAAPADTADTADTADRVEPSPARASPAADETASAFELAAGAGLAAGLWSDAAVQLELAGGLWRAPLGLLFSLRFALPQVEQLETDYAASVLAAGGRAGLRYAPWSPLRLGLGIELARVLASARGGHVEDSGGAFLLGAFVEAAPRARLWRGFYGELALSARYAFARPSVEISGRGVVHRVPAWGAEGDVRLGWAF